MYTWHLLRKYILSVLNTDTRKENDMMSAARGLHWAGALEGIRVAGVSVYANTSERKAGEICRRSVLAIFFSSGESRWVFLQSKSLKTLSTPTTGSLGFCLLILTISICLRFTGFWLRWNQSGTCMWCVQMLGKLVAHTAPLAPRCDRNSLAESSFLLALSNAGLCIVGWCRQNEAVFLFVFFTVILRFSLPLCCWFIKWTLELSPRAVFVKGYVSNYWYLWGKYRLGFPLCQFRMLLKFS